MGGARPISFQFGAAPQTDAGLRLKDRQFSLGVKALQAQSANNIRGRARRCQRACIVLFRLNIASVTDGLDMDGSTGELQLLRQWPSLNAVLTLSGGM